MFGHYLMLSDYRRDEQLDAVELCLQGFRDERLWHSTGTSTSTYCIFGSGMIGAFLHWQDLPLQQAISEWHRLMHGCDLPWRFVADPLGHWVNVIPKPPSQIVGHPEFDIHQTNLIALNREHWAREVVELLPQQAATKPEGDATATLTLRLTPAQIAALRRPHLLAIWKGAWDVTLNGVTALDSDAVHSPGFDRLALSGRTSGHS